MAAGLSSNFFKTESPIAVVAGGAGFIGSFVCQSLLKKGVRVVCVDDWQNGLKENINEFLTSKNFLLLEKDISARFSKKISKVDYVFHLSCLEPCLNSKDITIEFLNKVSLGTKNLLDLAKRHGARFLLALSEGERSSFAEKLSLQYGRERGVDVRVIRLVNVYGPRMLLVEGNPIAKIVKGAVYGNKTTLSSDGQNFSAVFVDDVAQAILRAAFVAGSNGLVVSVEPKTSFNDGLKKTIDWFVDKKIFQDKQQIVSVSGKDQTESGFWNNVLREKQSSEVSKKETPLAISGLKFFFGLMAGLLFWFVFLPFINLFVGFGSLSLARRGFLDDGNRGLYFLTRQADFWFSVSSNGFSRLGEFPFLEEISARFYQKASEGVKVARVENRVFDILEKSKLVLSGVFDKTNADDLSGKFTDLSSDLDRLSQELGFIEAEYGSEVNRGGNLDFFNRSLIEFASVIGREQSLLFGGRGEERSYVFLFQDKEVARGVGGGVESFGIAVFKNGKLDSWRLEDADPLETTDVSAFFPKSAADAKEVLEKHLGERVDGIFYFDKKHKKDVTDFIGDPRFGLAAFVRAFSQAAGKREVALWVEGAKISDILKTWRLDGSFSDPKCQTPSCTGDYLQVAIDSLVDSPKRRYSLEVTLEGSNLSHRMVISYPEDTDVSENFMIVVPDTSKKGSAFIVDSSSRNIEMGEYKEGGRKIFSLFVQSLSLGAKNLVVEWDVPVGHDSIGVDSDESQELSFVWQKQLGASSVASEVNFEYSPEIYEFVSSDPDALLTREGSLSYNTSLSGDFVLSIQWQTKN